MRSAIWSVGIIIAFITGAIFLPQLIGAGNLEPTAPPGPTMKTLDEIPPTWSQKLPSPERFVFVLDGEAVLDKETGLVWEQTPSADPLNVWTYYWELACEYCIDLEVANRKGWRPPTVEELASLIDNDNSNPALPTGHPFTLPVCPIPDEPCYYWSSTTHFSIIENAWLVDLRNGNVLHRGKYDVQSNYENYFVWCVRGGQGNDGTKSY